MSTSDRSARHALTCLLGLTMLAAPASADPKWMKVTPGAPEGTPATVAVDWTQSTPTLTVVDVTIHGFWLDRYQGPDGVEYDRLEFPGLETLNQVGAPDLPVVRARLAVTTKTEDVVFQGATLGTTPAVFADVRPAPTYELGEDGGEPDDEGDVKGTDPTWAYDAAIYGAAEPWPVTPFTVPVGDGVGPVQGATGLAMPVSWDPLNNTLTVYGESSWSWLSVGALNEPIELTKLQAKLAAVEYLNWQNVGGYYVPNPTDYHSRYLIVADQEWWKTLAPLQNLKKLQGYQVTTVEPSLGTVSVIRDLIEDWYDLGHAGMDHYVLLVGDVNQIPSGFVVAGNGKHIFSDDVYGRIGAYDQSAEVHVGRLSFDTDEQLVNQVDKIVDYQLGVNPGGGYDEALLVAHHEDWQTKYVASHERVRTGSYAQPPAFHVQYGHQLASNALVNLIINQEVGLVAYRGHGSTLTWAGWNEVENYDPSDIVNDLTNLTQPVVVWSFSCTNANIGWEANDVWDSINEVWMEVPHGAVASYGASRTTSTTPNHLLNEAMFKLVYDHGITTHGLAIAAAEHAIWLQYDGHHNPWAYLLLGDPSMTIRRSNQQLLSLDLPPLLQLDLVPGVLSSQLIGSNGTVEDGLVSLYKESFLPSRGDELVAAHWVGDANLIDLSVDVATPGTLHVTARDADGNVLCQQIEIAMGPAWSDLGHSMPGIGGVHPRLAGVGTLDGGSEFSLLLAEARKNSTAWLCIGVSELEAPFKGGVLVPDVGAPGFALPVPTGPDGEIDLTAEWPDGVPAGAELYFQYWVADSVGPFGYVASNGLRATTP